MQRSIPASSPAGLSSGAPITARAQRQPAHAGKHSGRNALRTRLSQLGFDLPPEQLDDVFKRFKARRAPLPSPVAGRRALCGGACQRACCPPCPAGLTGWVAHGCRGRPAAVERKPSSAGLHERCRPKPVPYLPIVRDFHSTVETLPCLCAQEVAEKKKEVTDDDVLALLGDEVHQATKAWQLTSLQARACPPRPSGRACVPDGAGSVAPLTVRLFSNRGAAPASVCTPRSQRACWLVTAGAPPGKLWHCSGAPAACRRTCLMPHQRGACVAKPPMQTGGGWTLMLGCPAVSFAWLPAEGAGAGGRAGGLRHQRPADGHRADAGPRRHHARGHRPRHGARRRRIQGH